MPVVARDAEPIQLGHPVCHIAASGQSILPAASHEQVSWPSVRVALGEHSDVARVDLGDTVLGHPLATGIGLLLIAHPVVEDVAIAAAILRRKLAPVTAPKKMVLLALATA